MSYIRIVGIGTNQPSSGWQVPVLRAAHKHTINRPMIGSQVSGADGEFDHFYQGGNPIQPVDWQVTFDLPATTYTGIDTQVTALLKYFATPGSISLDYPMKMFAEDRTGNEYFAYIKWIGVDLNNKYGDYLKIPVTITVRQIEGVWYRFEEINSETLTESATEYTMLAADLGNYHCLTEFVLTDDNGLNILYTEVYTRDNSLDGGSVVKWYDLYAGASELDINPAAYSVTDGDTDVYGNDVTTVTTIPWLFVTHTNDTIGIRSLVTGSAVTDATNATPIVVTTALNHGLSNGDCVAVQSIVGNTAANGVWVIANVTANTFELVGSVGNGAFVAGAGQWYQGGTISNIVPGAITAITTTVNHGLTTGEYVSLILLSAAGMEGNDMIQPVTVTGVNTFTVPVRIDGTYTSGAVWAYADFELIVYWWRTYVL